MAILTERRPAGDRASREFDDLFPGEQSRQDMVTQRTEDGDAGSRAVLVWGVKIERNHVFMLCILCGICGAPEGPGNRAMTAR